MCKFGKTRLKSNLNWLCPVALVIAAALTSGPALSAHRRGPSKAQSRPLSITVKNPRCPACLKTLKVYLLEMPEVKAVHLRSLATSAASVKLTVELKVEPKNINRTAAAGRVIERIKAHDLAVLSTSY